MLQMYDPKREYRNHKNELDCSIQRVLNHGIFINGPEVKELEEKLVEFVGSKYAIAVSNGTDALKIALLGCDVQAGDEVITVAHTWISTAEMIAIIGAKPVFCDICAETFNIDHTKIENLITDKTKAIIVVSLYGQTADMDAINDIGSRYNIPVIEDGAQSFGASYKGKRSGNLSTIGTTSFFPSKPLGCYGDGGAIFTSNEELYKKMKMIKNHGCIKRFEHEVIGMNARMDALQAAIVSTKIKWYEETMKKRNSCADYYSEKLGTKSNLIIPSIQSDHTSVWAQYSLLANSRNERDNYVKMLKENNVNAAIFYPAPLHLQPCFSYLGYSKGDLPVTEDICERIFNLPCYAELETHEQDKIIDILSM